MSYATIKSELRRSRYVLLLVGITACGALSGYVFYSHQFKSHLQSASDEAEVILALTSSYVSQYSQVRQNHQGVGTKNSHMPVPAEFRAKAAENFNQNLVSSSYFRAFMVGMPDRYIATPPTDAAMSETIASIAPGSNKPISAVVDVEGTPVMRTIYPSIANKPSCIDCHNEIQNPGIAWKLGDTMGAYIIDRGVRGAKDHDTVSGVFVGALVSLILLAITAVTILHRNLRRQARLLKHSANTDPLTGCLNRRGLDSITDKLLPASRRDIAVLALDLDRFKEINDTHGHDAGDLILLEFADRVRTQLRPVDAFARVGGEEFSIYIFDVDESTAENIAKRICEQIALVPMTVNDLEITVTVSIGAVHMNRAPAQPIAWYTRIADHLLYRAKSTGRNRVVWTPMAEA